ncbi:glycosyltransferase family 2 protein [uncultured Pseudacidovorax sp.]|uniref:glycosyltransferase family 2 protein n=1 Tax=uncultured Pseudacidovorax sp. TaxID=679313 RepID=UPI0025F068A7|nr:glycosyltransferase family 2 protein [uncultured Pseudacidovorax sp.]
MPVLPDRPPLTISIVSHGQQALILPLLHQLAELCGPLIHRVVLTVNIPEPDLLADAPPGLPLLRLDNPAPLGFGANNNQAFGHCETPWFLVLNPDIRLDHDVLSPLLAAASPQAGLLAPRILEPGKAAPEQHRALLTPHEILGRRKPGYAIPAAPDWIPGLFMLFRAEAYRQIGGFDERFFMYGEDFDICARLRLAGWRIQIAEDQQARHDAQRASHRRLRPLWWHVSSLLRVWRSGAFWRYRRLLAREAGAPSPRR